MQHRSTPASKQQAGSGGQQIGRLDGVSPSWGDGAGAASASPQAPSDAVMRNREEIWGERGREHTDSSVYSVEVTALARHERDKDDEIWGRVGDDYNNLIPVREAVFRC
jgi:hypothetical protein